MFFWCSYLLLSVGSFVLSKTTLCNIDLCNIDLCNIDMCNIDLCNIDLCNIILNYGKITAVVNVVYIVKLYLYNTVIVTITLSVEKWMSFFFYLNICSMVP